MSKMLLFEMPHMDEGDIQFDFELETYSPNEDGYLQFVSTLKSFSAGKPLQARAANREGVVYKLPIGSQGSFIQYIRDNTMLDMMLQKRFKKSTEQLITDLN